MTGRMWVNYCPVLRNERASSPSLRLQRPPPPAIQPNESHAAGKTMESPHGTCCSNKNQAGSFDRHLHENRLHLGRLQETSPGGEVRGWRKVVWKAKQWLGRRGRLISQRKRKVMTLLVKGSGLVSTVSSSFVGYSCLFGL